LIVVKNEPMKKDLLFKKVWGDPDGIQRTEALVSIMLRLPYEEVKGKLEVIETEKRLKRKSEKRQKSDIVIKLKFKLNNRINLEMNLTQNQSILDRNTTYLSSLLSNQMRNRQDYSTIEPVIQINFNTFNVYSNNEDIVDFYYLQNKNLYKLTEKLQIMHINIARCKDILYNGDIEKYSKEEQNIIRIAASMVVDNEKDLEKCLGDIDMDEKIKNDIADTVEEFWLDDEIFSHFGSDADTLALARGCISEGLQTKREDLVTEGLEMISAVHFGQGYDEGVDKRNSEIVKNMLSKNIDLDTISEITGLSLEEINEYKG